MAFEKTRKTFPGAPPGCEVIDTEDLAVDVKVTGAQATWTDTEDAESVAVTVNLTALAGGTTPSVTFNLQHSPDGVAGAAAFVFSAQTGAGRVTDVTKRNLHRFVRVAWATTGTPTTATANINITAKRR